MTTYSDQKPAQFVYLQEIAPQIIQDIRYATDNNFIGRPIHGYLKPVCLVTEAAAQALLKVEKILNKRGLGLKVFDCYRPQIAVDDFVQWSKQPKDQKMKTTYYPRVNKADFFKLGYIKARSNHTRGSTVDLTIVNLSTHQELDMGTHFDFMDTLSHPFTQHVTRLQFRNRMLLRNLMIQHGFAGIRTEWWHFSLRNEPFSNIYFNFPVQ